jgi:peptide/nickel transport system ATP-binding protein
VAERGAGTAERVLTIDGLSIELVTDAGWLKVVDDVTLEVRHGETVGLVGESGCGKSVTCMSILRLLDQSGTRTSGKIRVGDSEVGNLDTGQLRALRGGEVGMVFQEPMTSLNPVFTIGDQIAETVRWHTGASRREAMDRAVEMLGLVGIPNPARRRKAYPFTLSGGMRQRVMLAMALACQPRLLIADEPTTALDVTIQAQILDLIDRLQAELGMGILLVTHDLRVVAERCDRVYVMYAGEVVESATTGELFAEPSHPYTRGLLKALPEMSGRKERLGYVRGSVPVVPPSGCRFHPRCEHMVPGECTTAPVPIQDFGGHQSRCVRLADLRAGVLGE